MTSTAGTGEPSHQADYPVEQWLGAAELQSLASSTYWNDEAAERGKSWYVLDGDFARMEAYLKSEHLDDQLVTCIQVAQQAFDDIEGVGIDCACGVGWAIPIVQQQCPAVRLMYGVELSRHRISALAPAVLRHYRVAPDSVRLCLGSFYNLRLPDGGADFAILAQAFHHAFEPDRLLVELRRVLRPGGVALITGEHDLSPWRVVRRAIRQTGTALLRGRLPARPQWETLFPTDPVLGDHFYSRQQYADMFTRHGFEWRRVHRPGWPSVCYLLRRA